MKVKHRIVAVLILCTLLSSQFLFPVYAVEDEAASANSCSVVSSNYLIEEDSITEQVILSVNDETVTVSRTSFSNNISVVEMTQNGITVTEQYSVDFEVLKQLLSIRTATRSTSGGLEERYVTTFVTEEYLGPEYGTWSQIFGVVSLVLSPYSLPLSTITGVASLIFGNNSSDVETYLTVTRAFYEVYAAGDFLGYYNVHYSIVTEVVNQDGERVHIGTETGIYETLNIW